VPTGIFLSERNRPGDLTSDAVPTPSQRAAREMGLEATSSGKVSAAEVSTLTFEAIAAKQFYVFSHRAAQQHRGAHARDYRESEPAGAFAARPEIGAALRARLRDAR
jgi:hypothetical protein